MTAWGATAAHDAHTLAAGERRVRHARLRPVAPQGVWALRQAMEDALRCASFDDAGRLVLVRRLRILGLPTQAGAVVFGRALERAWREAARQAVPALSGPDIATAQEAAQATAVWFPSPAEAVLAALVRSLECASLDAWFWASAVPVLAEAHAVAERVPLLCAQLQALAPRTWQQAVARWPPARQLRLQRWAMQEGGARPGEVGRPAPDATVRRSSAASPVQSSLVLDERVALVEALAPSAKSLEVSVPTEALPPDAPAPMPAAERPEAARTIVVAYADALSSPDRASPPSADAQALPLAMQPHRVAHDVPLSRPAQATPPDLVPATVVPVAAQPAPSSGVPPPPRRPATAAPATPSAFPWLHDAAFSRHAGALWLVRLLDAVGFGGTRPNPSSVNAVLGGLFRTAGLPDEDPHWHLLPPDGVPSPSRETRLWQMQARRALRRRAGLSVAELARRPGWITHTLTHADVVLPMDAVDLRVRRLGLDSDPGYVPWLGRILRFHFVARVDWPEPD